MGRAAAADLAGNEGAVGAVGVTDLGAVGSGDLAEARQSVVAEGGGTGLEPGPRHVAEIVAGAEDLDVGAGGGADDFSAGEAEGIEVAGEAGNRARGGAGHRFGGDRGGGVGLDRVVADRAVEGS